MKFIDIINIYLLIKQITIYFLLKQFKSKIENNNYLQNQKIFIKSIYCHNHFIITMQPRVQKQLRDLQKQPPPGCLFVHRSETNDRQLLVYIIGPDNSPYSGRIFQLQVLLYDFPFEKPKCTFKTPIIHPYISQNGQLCRQTLGKWVPTCKLSTLIRLIVNMLQNPGHNYQVCPYHGNYQIRILYSKDRAKFEAKARQFSIQYATEAIQLTKRINQKLIAKQRQLKGKQKIIADLQKQIVQMEVVNNQMKESTDKLQTQLSTCKKQIQRLMKFESQKDILTQKLNHALNFIKTVQRQVLCQQIIDTENLKDNELKLIVDKLNRLKNFPDSQILSDSPLMKHRFMCQQLTRFLQIQSFQTKLVYRYPNIDTANFHKYFDNKINLLIMVKLANGTVIGGFTVEPFLANRVPNVNNGQGFLFSLTAERAFQMKIDSQQPMTTYDRFFLILGNADIRLKAGEKKVFSNFGIATSAFDNEGYTRTSFLGVQDETINEVEIDSFEIFEVIMIK